MISCEIRMIARICDAMLKRVQHDGRITRYNFLSKITIIDECRKLLFISDLKSKCN